MSTLRRRILLVKALKAFDLLSVILCFLLAAYLVNLPTEKITLAKFLAVRVKVQNIVLFSGFLALWSTILSWCALYSSRRLSTLWSEFPDILKATTFGTSILFILSLLFNIRMVNGAFIIAFWTNITVLIIASRVVIRYTLRHFRIKGRNLRNIIIAGTNARALSLARQLLSKPELGYRLLGFVDNNGSKIHLENCDYPLVADFESFTDYLRKHVVDEVMVCLPMESYYQQAAYIAHVCEEHGIITRILSDLFKMKLSVSSTEQFEGHPLMTLSTGNMVGQRMIVKRLMDILLSLLLIVILSPLMLFVALLIKLTDRNNIFFIQERIGLNKRHFRLYKFQTMFPDAEKRLTELESLNEVSGPVFKIKNDPRITPIGKFLRKTSIDELPQLFNVLKGDMSLVGPRPLPVRDYAGFDQDWHRRRFSVRPGITCIWQISGRNNISFDRWMEMDMEYIDNWSLWLDMKILIGTIPAVLKGSGAT